MITIVSMNHCCLACEFDLHVVPLSTAKWAKLRRSFTPGVRDLRMCPAFFMDYIKPGVLLLILVGTRISFFGL